MRFFRKKRRIIEIAPDEIFLDSKNLPDFDTQQFEGRLEKPISKNYFFAVGFFCVVCFSIFLYQSFTLQIAKGAEYLEKSENNTFLRHPIFTNRGIIYDRNKIALAWNSWDEKNEDQFESPTRSYIKGGGFSHVLGYVSYPAKDDMGIYWREYFEGKDGIEKVYDEMLRGENGTRIIERNVKNEVQSENIISPPVDGQDVFLTIDYRVQQELYKNIKEMAESRTFTGGAGVVMDIQNGEILALTSYPEYDSEILSKGEDKDTIKNYLTDKRKVFLNRNLNGLYAPGSIVKPFIGYAALKEGVIDPLKKILSNGSISIPNPYFPDQKTVFKDHGVFGYVNMAEAIAVSSDVYFYEVGGGYQNQKGIGISKIDEYMEMFGIGAKTGIDLLGEKEGVIPTPEWKKKTFKGDIWRVGDTYNSSIGQYGFQVTPVQMVRAVSSLANGGFLPTPHLYADHIDSKKQKEELKLDQNLMDTIHEGMRLAVTEGTATSLNIKSVEVAAKSGTAQVGLGNTNTNSWIIGFFPYKNPRYAFAVLMERGPKEASGNAPFVMSQTLQYMSISTPEYIK